LFENIQGHPSQHDLFQNTGYLDLKEHKFASG